MLRLPRAAALVVVPVVLATAGGCASTCRQMIDRRDTFVRRSRPSAPWHAAIRLPHAAVNALIAAQLPRIPAVQVRLPGPLGALLPPLVLATRRLELRLSDAGKVGFRVELEASLSGQTAFGIDADVAVSPRVNDQRELVVALRPVDFERVEPKIGPGALDRLTDRLERLVPPRARAWLPRRALVWGARATIGLLGTQLHRVLRATVLPRLGEISRLRLALPRYLPVSALGFLPAGARALLVLVRTHLPIWPGLTFDEASLPLARPEQVQVLLPGAAMAALTNWGMAEGLLPRRFDSSANARPDGANEVALNWESGPRPLKVIAWRIHSQPCAEVVIGGQPELRVPKPGALELGARDAHIERVTGSLLLQAAVWLRTRCDDSLTITRKIAANSSLSVGDRPIQLTIVEGGIAGELFWVGLKARCSVDSVPPVPDRVGKRPSNPLLRQHAPATWPIGGVGFLQPATGRGARPRRSADGGPEEERKKESGRNGERTERPAGPTRACSWEPGTDRAPE